MIDTAHMSSKVATGACLGNVKIVLSPVGTQLMAPKMTLRLV